MSRYRSSLVRGGADNAANWTAIPPSRITATDHRSGVLRTSQGPAANAAHNAAINGSVPSRASRGSGCTTSSTRHVIIAAAAADPMTRIRPVMAARLPSGRRTKGMTRPACKQSLSGPPGSHARREPDRASAEGGEPTARVGPDLSHLEAGGLAEVADVISTDPGPREPVAQRAPLPQPYLLTQKGRTGGFHFDQCPATRHDQFRDPAQQRARVTADPDVPVGQQQSRPAPGSRHRAEDVSAQRERTGRPGQPDGVRSDVNAQGGNPPLGQRHGQAPGPGTDIEGVSLAAVQNRSVTWHGARPLLGPERGAAAVGMLDLRPREASQRVLV